MCETGTRSGRDDGAHVRASANLAAGRFRSRPGAPWLGGPRAAVHGRATLTHMGTRQHRSFRFDPGTLERLERRALASGRTQTALVERYVDEGLRLEEHPAIVFNDGPAGRRASLVGSGLDVWEIVSTVQNSDGSAADAAAYLGVPDRMVTDALRYYADYRYEIDAWIAENDRMSEAEELRIRRVADAFS